MFNKLSTPIHIIGGGLAGCEASWQIAQSGIPVILHEMRPKKKSDAHKTDQLAELVCSNSFRSDDSSTNAVGLLHTEMRLAKSLIMKAADANKVPAGSALAVDRDGFSKTVTAALENHPLITIKREEIQEIPENWPHIIIATGPLTSPKLAKAIQTITGTEALSFFDAIAPIIYTDTINMDICWYQSRYDKIGPEGTGKDYLNCPLNKEQYEAFVQALKNAEKTEFRDFEKTPYFDGCLPIEVMAERGLETLRHGPMKPMGLTNAHNPTVKAYAVVQLRQDNKLGTLYNMVGFQTKLKYGEQVRIFRMIPGLENAEFARLGGLHRNTYLNSPIILDQTLRLKQRPGLRFAGQITGCEGYVESSAIGLLAGRFAAAEYHYNCPCLPPLTTALGALLNHITGGHIVDEKTGRKSFQPMNINFGLFPPIASASYSGKRLPSKEKKLAKKQAITARALDTCIQWLINEEKNKL
ncbi:methylenetetrahydrofolate--tRNA-(uracil(54)-C(5))-methyltransferase (FADH(2)-oxidizing) TrmFO [Bartonella henselae]|uniref:methylenetetrahydrofolate--tRNA-(uracil(54)- C(5))-methyltransferase (FADH(2)-oxidizing) TrmFO n=1 Tax=Bartonella henselae TaxID=38323 RepID=UPI00095F8F48|nr:methylenetetrahydrofolate--tRNA-(uracil(54)-C(5))-methyltransferase (FADH(2)-oxidizing) TrmFO [Bartonella henselae]OLL53797.1 tRNA (uracil-5-)-methyltransferase [Bartonella henselae]OLL53899.1 tRNA (uracil-5-)-methyltransferase [Bartonella henselae]UJM32949.1 methylenetetrahydrofolate--tRNA-(uracil(54)-C(5))-methyltransferase (FADH(2)-oxidizing) TrmFO [Bartonella henselae]